MPSRLSTTGASSRKGTIVLAVMTVAVSLVVSLGFLPAHAFADNAQSGAGSASRASAASTATATPQVADDPFKNAAVANMDDGLYLVDVKLEGGIGKAAIASPAEFEVFDGRGVITVEWSSENYDYMLVGGMKYLRANKTGNSQFVIPVLAYNEPFDVVGNTTAMSEAHEVDYRITVNLNSVQPYHPENIGSGTSAESGGPSAPWIVFIVCMVLSVGVIAAIIVIMRNYRKSPEV